MTPAEFKTKWAKVSAKESAAYQSHFDDLCRLLNLPTSLEADPKGEFFCFQKRVVKDVELFELHETPGLGGRYCRQNAAGLQSPCILAAATQKQPFSPPFRTLFNLSARLHLETASGGWAALPSLDDWEKEWGKNSQRNVQPKLLPVDFRSPQAAIAQSN